MLDQESRRIRATLIQANRTIRAPRQPLPTTPNAVLREHVMATGHPRRETRAFQLWFRTRGCTYDRSGQCSMCNYGVGPEIDPDRVARVVEHRLASVPEGACVYMSPSGSLLDPREVPPELLERLLRSLAERKPASYAFESRPELCLPETLDRVKELLPDTQLVCQMGVESWDPDVRLLAHLKPTPQRSYLTALSALGERGFDTIANVTLGGLGLSQREAWADALASVRGARGAGFSHQMVFPLSAKTGTLLGWAYERGMWIPPSLWTLIYLLAECADDNLDEDGVGDLDISWYSPEIDDVIQARPDGCSRCRAPLVDALTEFRRRPARIGLESILAWRECECPAQTAEELTADDRSYTDRLAEIAAAWEKASAAGREPLATA